VLAHRYRWTRFDPKALLKMAYYTDPNETNLIPSRIMVALRLNEAATDTELQDMIRRDVTLILHRFPALRPALAEAYKSGPPAGRTLAERAIAETDPSYLKALRSQ